MASYEIIRNRVPQYNSTTQNILASTVYTSSTPVIENPRERTVVIESATIDLSLADLDPNPLHEVMIFCDIKAPDVVPPGLVFGPNYFRLPGPLKTVNQFLFWLNDLLVKKPLPYNLGLFQINNDDLFTYDITPQAYSDAFTDGRFQLYFNSPLAEIMNGFVSEVPTEANGQLFYEARLQSGHTVAPIDTMFRLNKIKNVIFYTTLPITPTGFLDPVLNNATQEKILGTIEFNTLLYNIRVKTNWNYSPTVHRHYTMNQFDPVLQYELRVVLMYVDGTTRAHSLKPGERCDVNIAFFPRASVDELP